METRRDVLKAGFAGGTGVLFSTGLGTAAVDEEETEFGEPRRRIVVAADDGSLPAVVDTVVDYGFGALACATLPIALVVVPAELDAVLRDLDGVVNVVPDEELELVNADGRRATATDAVHDGHYLPDAFTGEGVGVAVVDTGVDPTHPDLDPAANYQYVGVPAELEAAAEGEASIGELLSVESTGSVEAETTLWVDAGDAVTDTNGHGTHVSATATGSGEASDGRHRGVAPDADLTVYSTDGPAVGLWAAVSAYDHLVASVRNGADVDVVSNSFAKTGADSTYDPDGPLETATWYAFQAGVLPVFAAGNAGAADSLNPLAAAPHVLSAGALDDDGSVAAFSSRGREAPRFHYRRGALRLLRRHHEGGDVDDPGLYRPGVVAPGVDVTSAMPPASTVDGEVRPESERYGTFSGTSTAAPAVAGAAALVAEAAGDAAPLSVIETIEEAARGGPEGERAAYGDGRLDVRGAVESVLD